MLVRGILRLLFRFIALLFRVYQTFLIVGVFMGISALAASAVGLGLFELAKAIALLLAQFGIHVQTLPNTEDVVGKLFGGTGMVVSFGFIAFWFRSKHRLVYSIVEVLVGAFLGLLAIDQYPFAKRLHLETSRIGVRSRGWDAWEHLCAGGCVVDKPRFDHRTLHPIALLHAVIGVRVGVVGTGTVLQRILLETDAIQTDPRKGTRVRATGARGGSELIPVRNSNDMLIFDRLNPGAEDGRHLRTTSCRNSAEAAGAAVVVKVHIQPVVLWGLHHGGALSEVLLHISS